MKKNKIHIVVSPDISQRRQALARLAVRHGFARVPRDALKIMTHEVSPGSLTDGYFILCDTYSFRGASFTNQRLYELAARGIFIALGVRSLPREYEWIAEVYLPSELGG